MGLFEITSVGKGGKTGRRLGVVRSTSMIKAVEILESNKRLPKRVRVFPAKLTKKKAKKKTRIYIR